MKAFFSQILCGMIFLGALSVSAQDQDVKFTILTPELDRSYSADVRRLLEGELTAVKILSLKSSFKLWKSMYEFGDDKWTRSKLRFAMVKHKIESLIRVIDGFTTRGEPAFHIVVYDDTGKAVYTDMVPHKKLERNADAEEGITPEIIADHFAPRLIAFFVDWDDRAKVDFELPPAPESTAEEEADETASEEGEDFDISQFYGDDVVEETDEEYEDADEEEEEDAFDEDTYFEDYEQGYDVSTLDKLYPTFLIGLGGGGEFFSYNLVPNVAVNFAQSFPFIKGGAGLILETWTKHESGWGFGVEAEARGNLFQMGQAGYGTVPANVIFPQQTWFGNSIRGNLILRLHNLKNYDGWGMAYGMRAGVRYFRMQHDQAYAPRYSPSSQGDNGLVDQFGNPVAVGEIVSPLPFAMVQVAPTVGADLEIPILIGPRRLRLAFQAELIPWAMHQEQLPPGDLQPTVFGFFVGSFFRVGLRNGWFLDFRASYMQTRQTWNSQVATNPSTRRGVPANQNQLTSFAGGSGALSTAHAGVSMGWEF